MLVKTETFESAIAVEKNFFLASKRICGFYRFSVDDGAKQYPINGDEFFSVI